MSSTSFPSKCVSVDDVTISFSGIQSSTFGIARAFVYRYEFRPALVTGLNTVTTFLVFARPTGIGELVRVLIEEQNSNFVLRPCAKGKLEVTKIGKPPSNVRISINDAYVVAVEGRITVEQFIFIESIRVYFFDYNQP